MLYINPMDSTYAARIADLPMEEMKRRVAFQELEKHFAYTLLREMRKTVPEGGLFSKGHEREVYEDMLDDALSTEMARTGQLGVAKMLEEQLRIEEMQKTLKRDVRSVAPRDAGATILIDG